VGLPNARRIDSARRDELVVAFDSEVMQFLRRNIKLA